MTNRRGIMPGRREEDFITKSQCLQRGEFCKTLHEDTKKHLEDKIDDLKVKVKENSDESKFNRKLLWGLLITALTTLLSIVVGLLMIIIKPMLVEALSKNAVVTIKLLRLLSQG